MAATTAVKTATRIQNSISAQLLEARALSNCQSRNDEDLRLLAARITAKGDQPSGDQVPFSLRQATPRASVSLPSAVTVWVYWRQFCEPT